MSGSNEAISAHPMWAAPATMLRAGCVAFLLGVAGCGGGSGGGTLPPSSAATPTPDATQSPAQRVVGTAESIDNGASGNPVGLRVVRSDNGDAFAVWQADDGTRRNLWANRYRKAMGAWGSAINIEACSGDIDQFDLTVDNGGNAVVAWRERVVDPTATRGNIMTARFSAAAGTWGTPVLLNANADGGDPKVASHADGTVLAVYLTDPVHFRLRGRTLDPVSGVWAPEVAVDQSRRDTGGSRFPTLVLDSSGNAVAAWAFGASSASLVDSNYFARSSGGWEQLPPDQGDRGVVPGSLVTIEGSNSDVHLAATPGGGFLVAWMTSGYDASGGGLEINISRFTSRTRTWSQAQTLVPRGAQGFQRQLERIGSDATGNTHVLFSEIDGARWALKTIRVSPTANSAIEVIDAAVSGSAARADLAVGPGGDAIAIWQQFEGGRPDDGSRSNIAINRFDRATGTWGSAMFAEAEPGNAISPHVSAAGDQALLGWIQSEDGVNRVKALLQPLAPVGP